MKDEYGYRVDDMRLQVLLISCPKCQATLGRDCKMRNGKVKMQGGLPLPHQARFDEFRKEVANGC